jgi:ribosomal protein S18 acetylase RimI-like enzyme
MSIIYTNNTGSLNRQQLQGFFVDWPDHPDPDTHLEILCKSYAAWLAFDGERCVGFINALSDGVFYAYISLLEVLPEYQGQGIGTELLQRMLETLEDMYAVDIVCDESIAPFYTAAGFSRCAGMAKRNYARQAAANKIKQTDN